MINSGLIQSVHGCISTGKEANVYHAIDYEGHSMAIKIYKTSILVFKDRDRYVSGEYRFRHGYSKSNPRKMVKLWAEKEMRNLKRLVEAGIPCPEPILLKTHVLVMTFIGDQARGFPAPRLKDAVIEGGPHVWTRLYRDCLVLIWKMYHNCRLVHADLSEYNLLYHNEVIFVIDVSQSVEMEHPFAFDFLRKDCANIHDFFARNGASVLSLRSVFDWVTSVSYDTLSKSLEALDAFFAFTTVLPSATPLVVEDVLSGKPNGFTDGSDLMIKMENDKVFMASFIPRNLEQVIDFERDIAKLEAGDTEDILYGNIIGLPNLTDVHSDNAMEHDLNLAVDSTSESDANSEAESEEVTNTLTSCKDKAARKANKKAVKEENRQRRLVKMKKSEKKKIIKKSQNKK